MTSNKYDRWIDDVNITNYALTISRKKSNKTA